MSFIKKLITLKIKPDNNFGRILNKTSLDTLLYLEVLFF